MLSKQVIDFFQHIQRCTECGATGKLDLHHRIFLSERETGLDKHLEEQFKIYEETRGKKLEKWKLNDIQNIVKLCQKCHLGKIHNGDNKLREKYRNSFTCPKTGFNIPFKKNNSLY
jgi:5-methylcytosine-specific restriction endonuclease McrA